MSEPLVSATEVRVRGTAARTFTGGAGPALLLVHGGWAGAQFHWRTVWEPLAARHRVIAPELPGLGAAEQGSLASVADYAAWLVELLDALGVDRAWCAGNSFGGTVVWSLAGRTPGRCAGVVLVDGVPMPRTPPPLRWLGRTRSGRALMRRLVRRASYEPGAVARAFADVARVPPELREAMATWPVIVPRFADLLIAGDGAPAPSAPTLLIFGAADRLPGTSPAAARRLRARLPGATLRFIEHAGHFPQIEAPAAFVAALERFIAGR